MSILLDLKKVVQNLRVAVFGLSSRVFELERSAIVSMCSVAVSDYDATTGLFKALTYTRANGTIALTSTLSVFNPSTNVFTQRTEVYYDATGSIIMRTVVYSLVYNADGVLTNENVTSIIN
jgi:hypothetical protein